MDEFVRRTLAFREDPRTVVRDDTAPYYGAVIDRSTLVPVEGARIFPTRLEEWLPANPPRKKRDRVPDAPTSAHPAPLRHPLPRTREGGGRQPARRVLRPARVGPHGKQREET
jgi:hypothetical protein